MILTETDGRLLDALGRYRMLTIVQAMRLNVGKDRTHLGERLRILANHKLVKLLNQRRMDGPRVHWLTEKGAELASGLAADRGEVLTLSAPKRGFVAGWHLRQRLAIVDCHISLRLWAEATGAVVEWFGVEFEANPAGMLGKALRYPWTGPDDKPAEYQPDAVGIVRLPDGERYLFAVEVETLGESQRIDNFSRQLAARLAAMQAGAIETGLTWPKTERRARLLFVFPDADVQARALAVCAKHESPAYRVVFLNTLPNLLRDVTEGWVKVTGEPGKPFSGQTKG
jgi:hypothetical protein